MLSFHIGVVGSRFLEFMSPGSCVELLSTLSCLMGPDLQLEVIDCGLPRCPVRIVEGPGIQ